MRSTHRGASAHWRISLSTGSTGLAARAPHTRPPAVERRARRAVVFKYLDLASSFELVSSLWPKPPGPCSSRRRRVVVPSSSRPPFGHVFVNEVYFPFRLFAMRGAYRHARRAVLRSPKQRLEDKKGSTSTHAQSSAQSKMSGGVLELPLPYPLRYRSSPVKRHRQEKTCRQSLSKERHLYRRTTA